MSNIKMSIAEVCDRYSIVSLKWEKIPQEREMLTKELKMYETEILGEHLSYVDRLKEVNKKIWDLESDIRKGKENELGLREVGKRAIAIRELNKIRVGIKNEMVKKYGEGFEDVKMNHASQ